MKNCISIIICLLSIHFCSAQNVGIGTTKPLTPLDVRGNNQVLRIQGTDPWIGFTDNTSDSTTYDGFVYFPDTSLVLGSRSGTNMPIILAPNNNPVLYTTAASDVGIGTPTPTQKLDVNGTVRAVNLMDQNGTKTDELRKGGGDSVVFSKGKGGVGLSYIIAVTGIYPSSDAGGSYNNIFIGEIRLFAGSFAPVGFMFCNGQLLSTTANSALYDIIGTTYGGDGITTFALPDLRGAVPVGMGQSGGGPSWNLGQKSN